MRTLGHTLASLGLVGTAAGLLPALYLGLRAAGDPEGLVDGLLRLTWVMPIVWLFGMWIESERRWSRTRGLMSVEIPILLVLALAATFFLGVLNDGRVIVTQATAASRSEQLRKQKGEDARIEGDLGPLAPLARWSHAHLPRSPVRLP